MHVTQLLWKVPVGANIDSHALVMLKEFCSFAGVVRLRAEVCTAEEGMWRYMQHLIMRSGAIASVAEHVVDCVLLRISYFPYPPILQLPSDYPHFLASVSEFKIGNCRIPALFYYF